MIAPPKAGARSAGERGGKGEPPFAEGCSSTPLLEPGRTVSSNRCNRDSQAPSRRVAARLRLVT